MVDTKYYFMRIEYNNLEGKSRFCSGIVSRSEDELLAELAKELLSESYGSELDNEVGDIIDNLDITCFNLI